MRCYRTSCNITLYIVWWPIQYRACVVDLLGLLCVAYTVCTSNLDLVSFFFVPALYFVLKLEIFPFLVSSLFVVSDVIASRGFSIACSHCSLLWCENGIVYQQVIKTFLSYH